MSLWFRLRAFARRLRRPASWDRALHDEVQAYLDHEIDDRMRSGMSPAEARRTALAESGGIEPVKEQVRAGATGAWFDTLRLDVRYACRALLHSRGFAIWVVGSLAIGMAVTIAALALLNAILVLPFPRRHGPEATRPGDSEPQLRSAGLLDPHVVPSRLLGAA